MTEVSITLRSHRKVGNLSAERWANKMPYQYKDGTKAMQEADHDIRSDETIMTLETTIRKYQTTMRRNMTGEDYTTVRRRENNDHMRGRSGRPRRYKRSSMGILKKRNIKLRSLEHDTILPHATHLLYLQALYLNHYQRRTMHPTNSETSTTTTTETPHAARSWTACYDDECFVHLSDKQAAYFPRQKTQRKPQHKGQKTR